MDSSDPYKPDKKHLLDSEHTIKVKIHLDKPLDSAGEVRAILNRVFFPDVKNSEHPLPEYCRADANVTKDNVFRVGNGVSPPIPVYSPDPDCSEKARQHKYEGTTILAVVVDESGRVACIKIEKPLRMGLNEKTVEKVETWKFKPAQRGGVPVAAEVSVEVQFNLY